MSHRNLDIERSRTVAIIMIRVGHSFNEKEMYKNLHFEQDFLSSNDDKKE